MILHPIAKHRVSNVGELKKALEGIPDDTLLECEMGDAVRIQTLRREGMPKGEISLVEISGYEDEWEDDEDDE